MPNHHLRPPAPRVPPDYDEPWRVGPSPGTRRRRRRRLLVPALSVAAVAAGAGVLYIAAPPDAPATQHPTRAPGSWLDKDRPPPGPALSRPGSPAAPGGRPGRDPRTPSGGAPAQADRSPDPTTGRPARPGGTGGADGRAPEQRPEHPRGAPPRGARPHGARPHDPHPHRGRAHGGRPHGDRPRTRKPPRAAPTPAWIERECRRRYPDDATRRDACAELLRQKLGR
ncbi:hypothetical protein [Actinomadura rifamycini]|uniref:hypothetical protein n=1 Tax=Actinomadura rifamycini TaxID=31962 RepID=UPI0003FF72E9|nr:hypothetical protein [Actinomadura rifamycini]